MVEELFSKKLLLTFKHQDREDRRCALRVTVELQTTVTPVHRKEMVTKLTDDNDFYFLYTMRLSEDDFQTLKAQQGLLVDFGAFPQKFIDLLNLCSQEENKEVPKFILQLVANSNSAILNIIETNPFKHLVHLALKFLPGTDCEVKKYLADCLKLAKEQNQVLLQKFQHTESNLSEQLKQTQDLLVSRSNELDHLKTDWNSRTGELTARYSSELQLEREKSLQAQTSAQQRIERERKDMEQAHIKIVKQLEAKISELDTINKQLTDKKYKYESQLRELKTQVTTLEEECQRSKLESQSCRRDLANLETDGREHEKLITQLKTRLAVLEQEVKDKDELLRKTSDQLNGEQTLKLKLTEDLDVRKKQIVKQQTSIKTLADEVQKANQIIKKLQDEIKGYVSKLKTRSHVTVEQEKVLSDKTRENEELRRELEQVKQLLRQKEDENKKLNESLEATTVKLEESRQLLKSNENIINWLNKQLTDVQISSQPAVGPFEMTAASNIRTSNRQIQSMRIPPGLVQTLDGGEGDMPRSAASVHYGAGLSNMSRPNAIQQPLAKSTPIIGSTALNSTQESSIQSTSHKISSPETFLDPKYLQRSTDQSASPQQQIASQSGHPSSAAFALSKQTFPSVSPTSLSTVNRPQGAVPLSVSQFLVSRPQSTTLPASQSIVARPGSATFPASQTVVSRPQSTTFPAGHSLASAYFPQKTS